MARTRIIFLSKRNIWSPTGGLSHYAMARALETHVGDVDALFTLERRRPSAIIERIQRVFSIPPKSSSSGTPIAASKMEAERIERVLKERGGHDVIFAPMAADLIAFLRTDKPIIYLSDATFRLMNGYYDPDDCLEGTDAEEREEIERRALGRADLVVLSSDWAARSVIDDYDVDPQKVRVFYAGPNLPSVPQYELSRPDLGGKIRLLMVGRDWRRKGGQIALDTIRELVNRGHGAHLTICGMVPPVEVDTENVSVVPFLDKAQKHDLNRLIGLYRDSHFLLFPSRAECHGLALNEANALGLPVLGSATGGIPDYIRPGVNGYLFPVDSGAKAYANKIASLVSDPAQYYKLRDTARHEYERRLNWRVWGSQMERETRRLLE